MNAHQALEGWMYLYSDRTQTEKSPSLCCTTTFI